MAGQNTEQKTELKTEQKAVQQSGIQNTSSTGQKKSLWLTIIEKVRNWCDNFIKKHDKSVQSDSKQAGKNPEQSTFANTDTFVHTEKDDALLNQQFNQIDSLDLRNNNYFEKYSDSIASMKSVDDFDKAIVADASLRFMAKDSTAEEGRNLSFEGYDNLTAEFTPESFSNVEQASKYWDDLSNAALNSGYAGAKMKEMQDVSYAQTDEYKSIVEDYTNRTASIKEAYGEDGKRIEQEFVNAYSQINNMEVGDGVDFTRRMLASGAILENGEIVGKDMTDADWQKIADDVATNNRGGIDLMEAPDVANEYSSPEA